jgi:uncharacterized coiled-coil DUF342 family protein
MKRKILSPVMCFLIVLFFMNGCGGSKYSDAIKLNVQYIGLMEMYIADLDKADNAKEVAKAINQYADGLEKIWPQMKKMSEKYPELKEKDNPPEELKASQKEAESVGRKMIGTYQKIMPYMGDPEVKEAQERISAIMQK